MATKAQWIAEFAEPMSANWLPELTQVTDRGFKNVKQSRVCARVAINQASSLFRGSDT